MKTSLLLRIKNIFVRSPLRLSQEIIKPLGFADDVLVSELKQMPKFLYVTNPGNIGDMLIALATLEFFKRYKFKYRMYSGQKKARYVVYGGGGAWTRDYEQWMGKFIRLFKSARRIVILPSSFYECTRLLSILDKRFVVFCRERKSYEYLISQNTGAKIMLDHDMALRLTANGLGYKYRIDDRGTDLLKKYQDIMVNKTAYFMRIDCESSGHYKTDIDISDLAHGSAKSSRDWIMLCSQVMLNIVVQANTIVTDRLHVGIAGLLLNKDVYLLDNSYGKLSSVYNHSLKKFKNVHFCKKMPKL